ncbi:PadR family transcriptional regulator [Sphingomonas sanxanigenens]|uniref:PadR family transcriptional regulator n=1 Tax=Sphingomonas sanxanigenens TaxID=397260 RepID=UPI00046CD6CD|nr:PadR family transcriptional regulator [Sphingomonas sanxanigenens]
MTRSRSPSPATRTLLALLVEAGEGWSHGYDLARLSGVKSGTLYPILIRLEAQGHLEAQWMPPAEPGRPARHAYRLTPAGRRFALQNPVASPQRGHAPLSGTPAR